MSSKRGLVSVNDLKTASEKRGSMTGAIQTCKIYGGIHKSYARKRELNIKILSTGDKSIIIRNIPIMGKTEINEIKTETDCNKYLHVGCVTVSIDPLIHLQYLMTHGKNITGICAIVDTTFRIPEESVISAHRFNLSEGRTDFVTYPNHCLSLSDENLQKRLSLLLIIDSLDVDPGNDMFNICIGYIVTGTNTLNPQGCKPKLINQGVTGASEISDADDQEKIKEAYEKARGGEGCALISDDHDEDITPKRRMIMRWLKPAHKTIMRRSFTMNPKTLLTKAPVKLQVADDFERYMKAKFEKAFMEPPRSSTGNMMSIPKRLMDPCLEQVECLKDKDEIKAINKANQALKTAAWIQIRRENDCEESSGESSEN